MYIKNNTLYDKNLILRYNRYYLVSFLRKNFTIVAIITLGFATYMFIVSQWKYGVFLVGILIAYFILTYLMQEITTKRILKKSPLVENPILQTYVFTKETIEIVNVKARSIAYNQIVKVRETKEFFILADISRTTYIVDKQGFENLEDIETLRNFLKLKMGKIFR